MKLTTTSSFPLSILSLFPEPHLALMIEAMVAGSSPALAWADDSARPRRALVWDKGHCLFLGGAPGDEDFNRAAAELLAAQILPEGRARNLGIYKLYYAEAWAPQLEPICGGIETKQAARVFYALERPRLTDWREHVPAGIVVRRIDAALMENARLANVDAVRQEIESGWRTVDDFLARGFGFYAHTQDAVVGWCTAEYVSGVKCGVGIETIEAYQKRGIATALAAAFVEHAAECGIQAHWDSWKENTPSVAVAEKVGFRRVLDYTVRWGSF